MVSKPTSGPIHRFCIHQRLLVLNRVLPSQTLEVVQAAARTRINRLMGLHT